MRTTWGLDGLGLGRLHLAGAVLALGFALAGCGGGSALRLVTAPSEPAAASPSVAVAMRSDSPLPTPDSRPTAVAVAMRSDSPLPTTDSRPTAGASAAAQSPASRAVPGGAHLQIPSIGLDASIVTLGVNRDGTMQVPNNGNDVGWYTFSATPGAAGNAVLSGHLDTATSPTAVFTRLKELKQGDPLSIAADGRKIDYSVFWTKAWADDAAPLALILGNAPSPTLTLITCAGTFDRASRNYSERLVVRAKLPGSV